MTQPPIGFAIAGAGMIAKHHARAILATPDARLVSVFARDAAKRDEFAAQHRCTSAASLAALVGDPAVQVVVIATPSGAHAEQATAAAAAGKHVLCEKPLDISLEKTDHIIDACAAGRVILCPVFQNRFGDPVRRIKHAVDSGRLGRLLLGRATVKWQRTTQYYQSGSWRGTRALDGGGCLMNQAIHTIDLLLHMMGEPVSVTGHTGTLLHSGIEVEDTACAVLRFANGAMGVIEATTATSPQLPASIEITGTRGTVATRGELLSAWDLADADAQDVAVRAAIDPFAVEPIEDEARFPKHRRQLDELIAAIRAGAPATSIPAADGRLALEVILGIYRSAETGEPYRFARRPERSRDALSARTPAATTP